MSNDTNYLESLLRRDGVFSINLIRTQWNDGRRERIICVAELDERIFGKSEIQTVDFCSLNGASENLKWLMD